MSLDSALFANLQKLLPEGADRPARLLIEAELVPLQGQRFQPTGFPDIGAATFEAKDGTHLLVESAQSMANRLEATIWDEGKEELIAAAKGLSYVRVVKKDGTYLTSSITEAHRLNSPYILEGEDRSVFEKIAQETGSSEGPASRKLLAKTLLRYDVNSLLHGVFLAKKELAGGRFRLERALSSFIEADGVHVAASGGVKNDHVNPAGDTAKGFGNVPFQRDEFTADRISAFFNLDLNLIRSYGLGQEVERLLVGLALFKIATLLEGDLRLRTACDLRMKTCHVSAPEGYALPKLSELQKALPDLVKDCATHFAVQDGGVTQVTCEVKASTKASKKNNES
ncbi:MAG: type I-U CRISPR-associated protein Cas7 [Myxococcales bacterium]|jgi:CRISPR-associated protein Csb1|nr:type I-U CRISPR-associated protein Cas7 [Myxococcales bacterium]